MSKPSHGGRAQSRQSGNEWTRERVERWMAETRSLVEQLPGIGDLPHEQVRWLLLSLTRGMDGAPRVATTAEPASGPRIRIHTLGRFAIEIDGRPLDFSGRLPRRPLDLLKAIIARGGRNVALTTLCADLWPDADGATAMQSFNVTLHRLRKLLDVKTALVVHGGCASLDPAVCWVDADVFERTVAQMDGHADSRPGLSDGSVERFDAALDLYQGAFLPMHEDPWSATLRERLRSKFVRAVRAYSARCDRLGQRDLAIAVYRRAIEIDPLAEELYHRLMAEYNALGQAAEAVALYRRCRLMLGKLLGVMPGLETRELYDTIQQTARMAAEILTEPSVEGLACGDDGSGRMALDAPARAAAVQPLDL